MRWHVRVTVMVWLSCGSSLWTSQMLSRGCQSQIGEQKVSDRKLEYKYTIIRTEKRESFRCLSQVLAFSKPLGKGPSLTLGSDCHIVFGRSEHRSCLCGFRCLGSSLLPLPQCDYFLSLCSRVPEICSSAVHLHNPTTVAVP